MRFVVDLYRTIIIAFCAISLTLGVTLLAAALDAKGPLKGQYPGWALAIAGTVAVLFILTTGGLALVVSAHDRHAEIADAIADIATSLERVAQHIDGRTAKEIGE